MFYEKPYCPVRIAIGELVLEGFSVVFHRNKKDNPVILATKDGVTHVFGTLRDGASYVTKTEWVQDLLDGDLRSFVCPNPSNFC